MIAANKLAPPSQSLLLAHPVRKGRARKAAFLSHLVPALEAAGWPVQVETSGRLLKSRNVVAGNLAAARLVLTAHYDTPARLPFPNFLAPRNLAVSLLYQLLLAAVVLALMLGIMLGLSLLGLPALAAALLVIALGAGMLWLLVAGPANPSNANDNTSGVLALLETALALPPELHSRVALVFFDNEELGLVGSAAFRAAHGRLADKLLLNFDCVGNGDTLLFVQTAACRRDGAVKQALEAAFRPPAGKAVLVDASPFTLYPSDQMMFSRGVGVAALKKAPVVGYYVNRIHTARDTVLDQENILFVRDGCLKMAENM